MITDYIIIGLLLFLIVSYFIGGGTTTSNQGFILERIDDLERLVKKNPIVSDGIFDDKIDEWHESDSELKLYEYLGLTFEQYKDWIKNPVEFEKKYK